MTTRLVPSITPGHQPHGHGALRPMLSQARPLPTPLMPVR